MKTVEELVAFAAGVEGQGTEDHQNCTYLKAELRVIAEQLVLLPKHAVVVEIGVFGGRSASLLFQLEPDLKFDIHLIDNWSWMPTMALPIFNRLVLDHFSDVPFTLHKMLSETLAARWSASIDFLHVDGWHDMPGIEPDCRLWLPFLKSGGIAAFHDSDCPPVAECIAKYCAGWQKVGEAGRTTVWRKP